MDDYYMYKDVIEKLMGNPFISSFDNHYNFYEEIRKFGIIIEKLKNDEDYPYSRLASGTMFLRL